MRVTQRIACLSVGLILMASPLRAQDSLTTMTGTPDCCFTLAPWLWRGQTFTVPAATAFLTSFTFHIGRETFGEAFSVQVRLALWNGINTVGPDLADETAWVDGFGTDPTSLETFIPPEPIAVTPHQTYLAFIVQEVGSDFGRLGRWGSSGPGTAVYTPTYGGHWVTEPDFDLGFTARFEGSAVPEPATIILLASGLIGVGLIRRRSNSG